MIFQHTWKKVLSGEKTQTRRIVKQNHTCGKVAPNTPLEFMKVGQSWGDIVAVRSNGRNVYEVGKTYAVQPARGKPAVARIRITDIRRENVREISDEDVKAEGFVSSLEFLLTWVTMHDKTAYTAYNTTDFTDGDESGITTHSKGWRSWIKGQRPAARYDAWVLCFEVVK